MDSPEISTSGSESAGEGAGLGVRILRLAGAADDALPAGRRAEGVRRTDAAVARGVPLAPASSEGTSLRPDLRDGAGELVGERSISWCPCVPGHPIGGSSGPASAPLTRVRVSARTTIAPPTAVAVKILARRPLWSTKTAVRSGR